MHIMLPFTLEVVQRSEVDHELIKRRASQCTRLEEEMRKRRDGRKDRLRWVVS